MVICIWSFNMKNEFNKILVLTAISLSVLWAFGHISPQITTNQASVVRVSHAEAKELPTGLIVAPLNKLLNWSQSLTTNYGLAIILMTLALRFMLTPLQYLSLKSMKKMKDIQPQLTSIKEKFSSDPSKVTAETLKLFKEKSVNPIMGFLPLLLQMPLFFSFYKLLRISPEIIGSNFVGWLTDLSLPDPLYVLPILAGMLQLVVMFYSANESHESKMGGKFKFVMSAVFTGIMLKMPAALLLYTITSSVYSVVEKGVINRIIG
jgi:YidC/Oxa1 family membrane protein insertase